MTVSIKHSGKHEEERKELIQRKRLFAMPTRHRQWWRQRRYNNYFKHYSNNSHKLINRRSFLNCTLRRRSRLKHRRSKQHRREVQVPWQEILRRCYGPEQTYDWKQLCYYPSGFGQATPENSMKWDTTEGMQDNERKEDEGLTCCDSFSEFVQFCWG
jgi:hypothetical protein